MDRIDTNPTTNRVMLDIETLDTDRSSAAIVAIGAVKFTTREGIIDEFSRAISIESCREAGLTIDGDTLNWWLKQDSEAQNSIVDGDELDEVLTAFTEWCGELDEVWANDPAFDCVILSNAYDTLNEQSDSNFDLFEVPWNYSQRRDYRTLTNLGIETDVQREEAKHDPCGDAAYQASVVIEILNEIQSSCANQV